MESRYILGQQALTPDGAVYQIIWDEPYNEDVTPDLVAQVLQYRAPENTVAGSTCIFNTEDADGYPVEWLFAYDGTDWALDRVVRGGSTGDGGATFPTFTFNDGWTCDLSYGDCAHLISTGGATNYPCKIEIIPADRYALMAFEGSGASSPIAVFFMGDTDASFYYYANGSIEEADEMPSR